MFSEQIQTRFSDTDALGHVNNAVLPAWFEGARDPIFRLFTPELDLSNWPLILAKIDVTFHAETYYGQPVEIRTYVRRIGGASFDVFQQSWQGDKLTASGTAVMVHFNNQTKKSSPIPDEVREQLTKHLYQE